MSNSYTHITLIGADSTCHLALNREISKNHCEYIAHMTKNEIYSAAVQGKPYNNLPYFAAKLAALMFSPSEKEQNYGAYLVDCEPDGQGYLIQTDLSVGNILQPKTEKGLISAAKCGTLSTAAKSDYSGKLRATVTVELVAEASTNDIYNWIQECNNPDTLRYLGRIVLNAAQRLENPPDPHEDDVLR